MGNLVFAFPVACIDVLSEGLKVLEVLGLAHAANLVFDLVGETSIEFMMEGGFPVAAKLRAKTIELNEVTDDAMSFLHAKVVELVLGITDGIMGTELAREFREELMPVVHPQGTLVGSDVAKQVGFKPLQGHTFQVGLSEGDFRSVFVEGPRTVLEVQLALDEESAKLFCLSAVEGIGFADSGSRRRLISLAGVASQQTYRTREIVKDDEGGVCVGWEVVVIKVIIVEVGVVRIITGTFVTRWTTCRGDQFTTCKGVFVVVGGRLADAKVGWTEGQAGVKDGAELR